MSLEFKRDPFPEAVLILYGISGFAIICNLILGGLIKLAAFYCTPQCLLFGYETYYSFRDALFFFLLCPPYPFIFDDMTQVDAHGEYLMHDPKPGCNCLLF